MLMPCQDLTSLSMSSWAMGKNEEYPGVCSKCQLPSNTARVETLREQIRKRLSNDPMDYVAERDSSSMNALSKVAFCWRRMWERALEPINARTEEEKISARKTAFECFQEYCAAREALAKEEYCHRHSLEPSNVELYEESSTCH